MIKVCVIGMGRAGMLHAKFFLNRVKGAELTAVVDPIESLAKKAGEEFRVPYFTDFTDIKDVDAAIICTPSYTHTGMIEEFASNGNHILCEKPLTLNLKDAERAMNSVRKAGVKLQIGYMRRFDRYYSEAKDRIDEGEIGKPLIFKSTARDPSLPSGWVSDPSLSGGIFLDMLSHDFDIARWLMGREVKSVYADGGAWIYEETKKKGDLDTVGVTLKFDKGMGLIEGCRKCPYGYDLRTEVVGQEGTLMIGNAYDPSLMIGKDECVRAKRAEWFWERFEAAFLKEDIHFIDCITGAGDEEPMVNGEDGRRALEINHFNLHLLPVW